MITLTMILCFTPIYTDNPDQFCSLRTKPATESVQEYCDQAATNPNYRLNLCQEFKHTTWERKLLK